MHIEFDQYIENIILDTVDEFKSEAKFHQTVSLQFFVLFFLLFIFIFFVIWISPTIEWRSDVGFLNRQTFWRTYLFHVNQKKPLISQSRFCLPSSSSWFGTSSSSWPSVWVSTSCSTTTSRTLQSKVQVVP